MKYRLAIFDFDGTLADSFPFFIDVFDQLAERHGFDRIDAASIPQLRGCDARELMAHVGLPAWKLPHVARDFTTLMRANTTAIRCFDGIDEVLAHLARAGVSIAVVSSNSEDNVKAVLGPENVRCIGHFECGMSIFGKTSRLEKVRRNAAVRPDETIYVGDQRTDHEAARRAGIAFGAVAWGYGTPESLRRLAPEEEFAQVRDLRRIA